MPVYVSPNGADLLAQGLFDSLTADGDFTLPVVDLSGPEYAFPVELDNELYTDVTSLTEADLTTRIVGGAGLFDGLMEALSSHLDGQYQQNRITGQEYATAYVAMTTAAMDNAIQFLINKDSAYWQAQLAQKQARAAEIAAVTARAELELTKTKLAIARVDLNDAEASYALTKMKLATEDQAIGLGKAQVQRADYELSTLLPKQVEKMDYELTYILPKELLKTQSQIDVGAAQISHITAQKDQVLYQTSAILPAQKLGIDAETSLKDFQRTDYIPAQILVLEAEHAGKVYTNTNLLPANLSNINEQTEAHRGKTLDTRLDGITPIAGSTKASNDLMVQQKDSYQRADEMRVGKAFIDTWITQKSIDEGLSAPSNLNNTNLDAVLTKIRLAHSLD